MLATACLQIFGLITKLNMVCMPIIHIIIYSGVMDYDPETLDKQYDTSKWVPNEMLHIQLWIDESAKNVPQYSDVPYGHG